MPKTVQISIPIPGDDQYYYSLPDKFIDVAEIGKRVIVPLGNRRSIGFIVGFESAPEGLDLKDILDVIDDEQLFGNDRLEFFKWISGYYLCPLGIVLKAAHPGVLGTGLKRQVLITDKGRRYLESDNTDDVITRVLNSVELAGELTAEKIFDIVEGSNFALLNSLRRRKLVDYDYQFEDRARKKLKRVIYPEKNDPEDKELENKPAKRYLMQFFQQHGRISLDDLKELFSNVNVHIKWLEDKGYVRSDYEEVVRDPFAHLKAVKEKIPVLNRDQMDVLEKLIESVDSGIYAPFLLNGVTGSGKTEIYLRTIRRVLELGKQAIVLVPEISLTPQLVKRFKSRFGDSVAVIHSMLSDGERFDTWRRAKSGEIEIVIGARSAIFAPFDNIGTIIVDEEHENSYKQDEMPCYNARDLSLVLGSMTNATVILGSATPSLESYYNSIKKKIGYLSLPNRVRGQSMPDVEIVDMRRESGIIFSRLLKSAIIENFRNGNQTILFLNRRGYSTSLVCEKCGDIFKCPNCDIPLTYHRNNNRVKCHYCGLDENFVNSCRECDSLYRGFGIGTQTVEQEIAGFVPGARLHRMDRDSAGTKMKLMDIYNKLENNRIDILIGTQMVAKGHDLPGVTLVGVISADMMLAIPDFRSGERTFQLITQVAGRAGRGENPGTVIVQTYNSEHPSIRHAVQQDSVRFLDKELVLRDSLGYPPYTKMLNILFKGKDEDSTRKYVHYVHQSALSSASNIRKGEIDIMGPSQCPVYKMKNTYRWQMLLRSKDFKILHAFASKLYEVTKPGRGNIRVSLDVDPQNFY